MNQLVTKRIAPFADALCPSGCARLARLLSLFIFISALPVSCGVSAPLSVKDSGDMAHQDATGHEAPSSTDLESDSSTWSPLDPCQSDFDCPGGVCVLAPTQSVCVHLCDKGCLAGFGCSKGVTSGGSAISACLPNAWELCRPCTSSSACGAPGNLCVQVGSSGTYCGLGCATGDDCPSGSACLAVLPLGGLELVTQCIPLSLTCGCKPYHAGSGRSCTIKNSFGECPGQQLCQSDSTWSACLGVAPAEEMCNGIDDNCDGNVDEGFPDYDLDGKADCVDTDLDGDEIQDDEDNCPVAFNPGQEDNDGDGMGDKCDPDDDNDGWPDFYDCQPTDPASFPGAPEVKDGIDNNCNGVVDEDEENPYDWEECGLGCSSMSVGPGQKSPFSGDQEQTKGLITDDKGYLKLQKGVLQFAYIWIANSPENTISRLDTDSGMEVSRHKVCNDPSRTAVDLNGNVWAACRGDGKVAKIMLNEMDCIDKNLNGLIDTSVDLNGDGKVTGSEVLPTALDECVKFVVHPAGAGAQRAAGVDKENHAWLGDWNAQKLYRLEPEQGTTVQTIQLQDNPYGLAIDSKGIIWVSGRGLGKLWRVDPETGQSQGLTPDGDNGGWWGGYMPYGVGVDSKDRVWTASCFNESKLHRYDPSTGEWLNVQVPEFPRGVAARADGTVFAALDSSSGVAIVDGENMKLLASVSLGPGRSPVGISIDYKGFVWAVNQGKNSATKIDPEKQEIIGEYPVGLSPYTYSDMTGYQLYTFTSPVGHYVHTFSSEGLAKGYWSLLNVEFAAPQGTSIKLQYRSADDVESLKKAPWHVVPNPFPPAEFPIDITGKPGTDGVFLQVQISLHAGKDGASPLLKKLEAQFQAN